MRLRLFLMVGLAGLLVDARAPGTPETVMSAESEFKSICAFCGQGHRISDTNKTSASVHLVCAQCGSTVDILEPDSGGRLHRPPWYLRLGQPPLDVSPARLWLWVQLHIRYVRDGHSQRFPEAWQLAEETYRWRAGDCEDSAILLADWLRAEGHEAYVATGRVDTAAHAWVVLIQDGETYLLETTAKVGVNRRVPPLAKWLPRYNPSGFVFDESGVRVRRDKAWTADYRSHERWRSLLLAD